MPKYSSTSKNLTQEAILGSAFLIIILLAISSVLTTIPVKIIVITITSFVIALLVYDARKRSLTIEFHEEKVFVKYKYKPKIFHIHYISITELEYINVSKSPTTNRLKFNIGTKKKSIKFLTIKNENYIDFTKWLKSKNEKIKFTVYPSDDYMTHRLQEAYGFKYRKFIKDTL